MEQKKISDRLIAQKSFFNKGITQPLHFRINALLQFKEVINQYSNEIIEALFKDLKRSPTESFISEVALIQKEIVCVSQNLRKWCKPQKYPSPLMIKPINSQLIPEPLGLVLIIGPWNYPFALTLVPLISAIAAGNCVVIKPSEHCSHSSNTIEKIISQAFDKNHVSVVQGDVKVAETLLKWPWNHLFFTGSTDVGKKVMQACSQHLTPVTLELGGKNPCIIHKEIDIIKTARRVTWGKFFNAGQTCIAPDYLWIHRSLTNSLIPEIERTIQQFYGENPQNSPYFARIINRSHYQRLTEFISTNQVLLGGQTDEDDLYIAPTLLKDINWNCKIMQSEIFGPILPVMEYDTIEEVIAVLQERPTALTCHLFTNNKTVQEKVREGVQSGSLCINTTFSQVMNRNLPFGGVGASGMGKYFAKAGFDTFSHYRAVVRKNFLWESSFVYPPYKIDLKTFKRIIPWIN